MSLINCPECSKQVSDSAITCPDCGFQVSSPVQTIQQTSKKYKLAQAIGVLLTVSAMPLVLIGANSSSQNTSTAGILCFIVGPCIYFAGRFGAWWNNK